jgi:hypothetical protein
MYDDPDFDESMTVEEATARMRARYPQMDEHRLRFIVEVGLGRVEGDVIVVDPADPATFPPD